MGDEDVARWIVAAVLICLIPIYYWQRKRARTRHKARHVELAEIGRLLGCGAYVEAAHRSVALQDKCSRLDSAADREIILHAAEYLAFARVDVGNLADAEADLAATLKRLGPDYRPDLRTDWSVTAALAWVVVMRGRYAEGIDIAERVVRECVQRWVEDAQIVRRARRTLGACLTEGGRPEQALPILAASLDDALNRCAENSAPVIDARHRLAEAHLKLHMLDDAEAGFTLALSAYANDRHNATAATGVRFGLAKIAALRGRLDEATEGFTGVLTELRDTAGPLGPHTLLTRSNWPKWTHSEATWTRRWPSIAASWPIASRHSDPTIRIPRSAAQPSRSQRIDQSWAQTCKVGR